MKHWLLLLALAAPVAAQRIPDHQVDFSALFSAERDQCGVGACHTFASVAIVEAAQRRRYSQSAPAYYSDADLFIRQTILASPRFGLRMSTRDGRREIMRFLVEGGPVDEDLRFALKAGLARNRSVPWDDFLVKFDRYRRALEGECVALPADEPPPDCDDPRLSALLDSRAVDRAALEDYFYAGLDMDAIRKERAESLRALRGFEVRGENWPGATGEERDCDPTRAERLRRLKEQLGRRRPVAIAVDTEGLAGYDGAGSHAVAVRGYAVRGGRHVLLVRNSWGRGRSPDLPEEELCRITGVYWLEP